MDLLKLVQADQIPAAGPAPDDLIALFRTCCQMEKVCVDNKGIGLSAVQVGVPWKLYVVYYPDSRSRGVKNPFEYFVNCEYEGVGEKTKSIEGCLSLTDNGRLRHFELERFKKIKLRGQELFVNKEGRPDLRPVDKEISGYYAVVHAHEIDHQNGILISDIGKEIIIL